MKVNKAFRNIKGLLNSKEEKIQLKWIYFVAVFYAVFCLTSDGYHTFQDSEGYVIALDTFMSGEMAWRTPTYPLFLGVIRMFVGAKLLYWGAVCLQWIVFLFSIRYFYKLVRLFSRKNNISFWTTLFYCLVPGITSWNNTILTESLAISGSVFLFYFSVNGWLNLKLSSLAWFVVILLLLCMLRPALLYLLPLFLFFWFVSFFIKGKTIAACVGFSGTLFVLCVVLFYSLCYKKTFGVFTPSGVGTLNQYCILRQRNLLEPDFASNMAMKKDIEKILLKEKVEIEYYEEYDVLYHKYGLKDIHHMVTASIKNNIGKFLKEAWKMAGRVSNWNLFDSYVKKPVIKLKMNLFYLIISIYAIYLMAIMYRKKRIPLLSLLICTAGYANLILVFIGAQAEWTRLLVPSVPLYLLMFAQLLSALGLKIAIRKDNDFQLV